MSITDEPPNPAYKIAILYSDAKREYFATEEHYLTEVEVQDRAKVIAGYLQQLGHQCQLVAGDDQLTIQLKQFQPDLVINLVDSIYGREYLSSAIPGVLELLKIPYTGSGILGQSLNSNKYLTKSLLQQYGVPTPKFQFFATHQDEVDPQMNYPLMVKLNEIHGSVEITQDSICFNERQLRKQLANLYRTYQQPLVVEEFIAGDEVTVILIEGSVTKLYSAQKIFADQSPFAQIMTFEKNWDDEIIEYHKYQLPYQVKKSIKTAYSILKMEDYAKFDLRVDQAGRHYVIDANSNPCMGPAGYSATGSILEMYDIKFETFLERLIKNTLHQTNGLTP
jgi:D-alanine-D-alanine ligase